MTIWHSKTVSPPADAAIHVKYSSLTLSGDRKTQVADAVQRARYMLAYVIGRMGDRGALSDTTKAVAAYYFKTPDTGPNATDFNTIKANLELILGGLGAAVAIKISKSDSTIGYVNLHGSSRKKRWTKGKFRGDDIHRGDIHVSTYRLDTGIKLAAKTVIHEAAHKFASAADFGERGYTWDGNGTFREAGLTHDEALSNAESYGRFVLEVFDAEVGW